MIDWRRPFGRRREAAPEVKDSATGPVVAFSHAGRPVWTPRDYESLAREGFAKNPVAYRCVRMIAEAAAATPLAVFEGGERVGADHPLVRLLARPNPEQSGAELFEALHGSLQTAGNAYLEAAGEGLDELYVLRPDRVKVVPAANGWPAAYDYTVGARTVRLARAADGFSPVLHMRLFNPADDWYGFSPMEAAAFAIDVHNASGAWNKALLDNAARPSGALIYSGGDGGRMTGEQFETLKAELATQHAGSANAGRPLLLEGGLDWRPMSLTPHDMDFIAGKHAAAREIALAFGVPPQLLGIPGDSTYANYREANAAFWRQTVVPLVRKTAGAMTAWLAPRCDGCRIEADLDAVPALQPERDALWARLGAAGFLNDDERRRMAGVGG